MEEERDDIYLPNSDGSQEEPEPDEPIVIPDEDPRTDEVPG